VTDYSILLLHRSMACVSVPQPWRQLTPCL